MNPTARLGLFAALLALVFVGAAMAGSALDPDVARESASSSDDGGHSADGEQGAAHSTSADAPASAPSRVLET
jgi:hypothetical protein